MKDKVIVALKIKLLSGLNMKEDWEGIIELDSSAPLEDLHLAIQSALSFDNDHLHEFYVARAPNSRSRFVVEDGDEHPADITIAHLLPFPKNHRLYYLFDYGDSWLFQISAARQLFPSQEQGISYPRLINEKGVRPEQYP